MRDLLKIIIAFGTLAAIFLVSFALSFVIAFAVIWACNWAYTRRRDFKSQICYSRGNCNCWFTDAIYA